MLLFVAKGYVAADLPLGIARLIEPTAGVVFVRIWIIIVTIFIVVGVLFIIYEQSFYDWQHKRFIFGAILTVFGMGQLVSGVKI
jgi:hypothetical protein